MSILASSDVYSSWTHFSFELVLVSKKGEPSRTELFETVYLLSTDPKATA